MAQVRSKTGRFHSTMPGEKLAMTVRIAPTTLALVRDRARASGQQINQLVESCLECALAKIAPGNLGSGTIGDGDITGTAQQLAENESVESPRFNGPGSQFRYRF